MFLENSFTDTLLNYAGVWHWCGESTAYLSTMPYSIGNVSLLPMHVDRKFHLTELDKATLKASVVRIVREQAGETGFFQRVSIWDVSSAQLVTKIGTRRIDW
jgi:hypothetical protein